jgi:hypothetical protein
MSKFLDDVLLECGEGWNDLISEWADEVEKLYKENNVEISDLGILQIKEKYGGLRIYLGFDFESDFSLNEKIFEITDKYEEKSYHICEICGKSGHLSQKGGIFKTLCDEHRDDFGFIKLDDKERE